MKYIDADKLKAHIEAKMEILWDKLPDADKEHPTDIELRDLGMYMALECLIDDLDSLQQEQPDEPDKSLDEEISRTYHNGSVADTSDLDHNTYENIARHFAEWGAEHLKK